MGKYDYGAAASGALTGAGVGSAIFPGVGTAIGAGIGGLVGLFGSKKKKKKKPKQISTLDPKQQTLYDEDVKSLYGNGQFSNLYNFDADAANKNFDQMYSRPAYRNFEENVVPKITGQYRSGNLENSSYSAEALSKAGRDVQENLDAHRGNMIYQGSQAAQDRKFQAIDRTLGRQTFAYEQPQESRNGVDQILNSLGPEASKWFADYLKNKNQGQGQTAPAGTATI